MKKYFCILLYLVLSHSIAIAQEESSCSFNSKRSSIVVNDLNVDGDIDAMDCLLSYVKGLLESGIDNIEMSKNPKMLTIMSDFFSESTMVVNGLSDYKTNLKPCISLIDDDVIDRQIKSSGGYVANQGGYFSVLFPITLSLGKKHGKVILAAIACEGHRVGFTPLSSSSDSYSELNTNGKAVKWLHDIKG